MSQQPKVDRLVYTLDEAAEALGVSVQTIRRLIKAGRFPHARVGGKLRVPVDALKTFLAEGGTEQHLRTTGGYERDVDSAKGDGGPQ